MWHQPEIIFTDLLNSHGLGKILENVSSQNMFTYYDNIYLVSVIT